MPRMVEPMRNGGSHRDGVFARFVMCWLGGVKKENHRHQWLPIYESRKLAAASGDYRLGVFSIAHVIIISGIRDDGYFTFSAAVFARTLLDLARRSIKISSCQRLIISIISFAYIRCCGAAALRPGEREGTVAAHWWWWLAQHHRGASDGGYLDIMA